MKKLSFSLVLVFLVIGIRVELAESAPDIRGEYYGSYTTVVTSCSDSASNGTYNAVLEMSMSTQSGNTFSGTATGTFNIDNSALIGGWLYNPGTLAESGILTIIDDTNYMFVVDGEPDGGGGRGMERGTYTWNSTTGAFTATAISKTLGDWGVSSLGEMTISVNENTLNVIESIEGPFSFTKISSESNPIVGSWFFNPGSLADSAVVIFIDGTNYMFAVDGEPDDGGGRGMERGTYTWNSTTGAFTATAISGTAGDWGISYLNDPTASIDGNTLTIIDSNDGPIPLTKVEGFAPVEYIQLSGTITETGQVSGITSHTFLGTGGEGTFTGQLSGNTLSIVNPGQDTYGDTCNYTRTMSATRAGISPKPNIIPIISLLLEDDSIGFTYAELSGNTFQLTYTEFSTCVDEGTFINNEQYIGSDGGTYDYTIDNGCIILDPVPDSKLCVKSRVGEEVIAEFTTNGGDFVDRTVQWNTDFSILNNDAIALKDWFVTNGWWPGSAILADGRVTNQDASFDGKWWIDNNVLYIAHPESDAHPENSGCVDYKAYKLVNDRLLFATDAAHTYKVTMIKM